MSQYVRPLLIVVLLAFLAGCSLIGQRSSASGELQLLSPNEGPKTAVLKQRVSFTRQHKKQTFIVLNRITPEQLTTVVLLATGQVFLRMTYDGQNFTSDNVTNTRLPARDMMALMQFTLWPIDVVRNAYPYTDGWQFRSNENQRELMLDNRPYLVMMKTTSGLTIEHVKHGYQVTIQSLESEHFE